MILCEASLLPVHTAALVLPGYQGRDSPGALEALEASYLITLRASQSGVDVTQNPAVFHLNPNSSLLGSELDSGSESFSNMSNSTILGSQPCSLEQVCT